MILHKHCPYILKINGSAHSFFGAYIAIAMFKLRFTDIAEV